MLSRVPFLLWTQISLVWLLPWLQLFLLFLKDPLTTQYIRGGRMLKWGSLRRIHSIGVPVTVLKGYVSTISVEGFSPVGREEQKGEIK